MFHCPAITPAAMPPPTAWTTIRAIRREQFHMTPTGTATTIIVMPARGPTAAGTPSAPVPRLLALAGTASSALWTPSAGSAGNAAAEFALIRLRGKT